MFRGFIKRVNLNGRCKNVNIKTGISQSKWKSDACQN